MGYDSPLCTGADRGAGITAWGPEGEVVPTQLPFPAAKQLVDIPDDVVPRRGQATLAVQAADVALRATSHWCHHERLSFTHATEHDDVEPRFPREPK